MHSFTFSLTSALDGVDGQHHTPVTLPPAKPQYPSFGRAHDRSGRLRKISPQPEFDPRAVQPVTKRCNLEIGLRLNIGKVTSLPYVFPCISPVIFKA